MAKRRTGTITINPIKERERSPDVVKVTSTSSVTQFHTSLGSSTNVSKTKKYETAANSLRQKRQQQETSKSDSKLPVETNSGQISKLKVNELHEECSNDSFNASSIVTTSSCSCEDHSDYEEDKAHEGSKEPHSNQHVSAKINDTTTTTTTTSNANTATDIANATQHFNKQEYKIKKSNKSYNSKCQGKANDNNDDSHSSIDDHERRPNKRSSSGHKIDTSPNQSWQNDRKKSKLSINVRDRKNKHDDQMHIHYEKSLRDRGHSGHRSRQEEEQSATFYDRRGHERHLVNDRKRRYYDFDDNGYSSYRGHRQEESNFMNYHHSKRHEHHEASSDNYHYHHHSSTYESTANFHRSNEKSVMDSRKRQRSTYEPYRSSSKDQFNHHHRQISSRHRQGSTDHRSAHQIPQSVDDPVQSPANKLNIRKKQRSEKEVKIKKADDKFKCNHETNSSDEKAEKSLCSTPKDCSKEEGNESIGNSNYKERTSVENSNGTNKTVASTSANTNENNESASLKSNEEKNKSQLDDVASDEGYKEKKKESKEDSIAESKSKSTLASSIGIVKKAVTAPSKTSSDSKTSRLAVKSYSDLLSYFFKDAIYFIMKSNIQDNIDIAMSKSLWSTPALNEAKLNHAFIYYRNVILIFSTKESGKFAGFARLSSPLKTPPNGRVNWVLPSGINEETFFNGAFELDWICKKDLQFTKTTHLFNPLNEGKPVKIARDGQQVDNAIAEQLLTLFPPDESIDLIPLLKKMKRQTKNRPSMMPIVSMVPMMLHQNQSEGYIGHGDSRLRERLSVHRRLGPKLNLRLGPPIVTSNYNSSSGLDTSYSNHRSSSWKRRR